MVAFLPYCHSSTDPLLSGGKHNRQKRELSHRRMVEFFPEIQYHRFVAPANAGVQ
jgi:hypothetical protein